ncbi:hypothetical protein IFM89_037152 [Coptis chinensis]|uniref:Uncharacterized protein n=1 Tax=Coptis chinensis TaxID=261450 RepID=A0A835M0K5_9MAGN|nr:hypothetical protein IFM89_037152 [Coptis chinensis]
MESSEETSVNCYDTVRRSWDLIDDIGSSGSGLKELSQKFKSCRVTCRSRMCTTPIEVTYSQLIASEIFPSGVVKAILYPGAVANGLIKNRTIPKWDNVLNIYNLTEVKEASPNRSPNRGLTFLFSLLYLLQDLVLAGSYFSMLGALVGLLKPGRMSMFGTLLVIWGLVKEGLLGKPVNIDPAKVVSVYPTMLITLLLAIYIRP